MVLAILYLKGMPKHAGASSLGRHPHPAYSNYHKKSTLSFVATRQKPEPHYSCCAPAEH